jgi:hypothetical protein
LPRASGFCWEIKDIIIRVLMSGASNLTEYMAMSRMSFDREYKYLVGSWSVGWVLSMVAWPPLWGEASNRSVGITTSRVLSSLLLGAAAWALIGWMNGIVLRRAQPRIGRRHVIAIIAIWVVGVLATGILPFFTRDLEIIILNRLGWYSSLLTMLGAAAIGGAMIGGGTAAILLQPNSPWRWKLLKVSAISLIWSILFVAGAYLSLVRRYGGLSI